MDTLQEYLDAHEVQTRDAKDVVEEFSDQIYRMKGRCIDLGCGPGTVTRNIFMPKLPADATVAGCDISETMIDFAKKEHADEKRLSFLALDIEAEKLPSHVINSFDNIVSFYCLHWCQNIGKTFENIFKMMRPKGTGLVMFLAQNSGFDTYQMIPNEYPEYQQYMEDVLNYVPYFQNVKNPRATLKKMLETVGFKVHHCSLREKTFVYKNRKVLKKHIVAVNPFASRMPEDLAKQFENDLTSEVINGKITFHKNADGSNDEFKILDVYYILVAYFEKTDN